MEGKRGEAMRAGKGWQQGGKEEWGEKSKWDIKE